MLNILSLGAGVQSSTMALMAAKGEIRPMPEAAIFADTQVEPKAVYEWLDWLEKQLPFPVHRVTAGNLWEESIKLRLSKTSGQVYVKTLIPAYIDKGEGKKGLLGRKCTADYKVREIIRKAQSMVADKMKQWRADNKDALKLWIAYKKEKALAKKEKRSPTLGFPRAAYQSMQKNALVRQWIGISWDETERMKPSQEPWSESVWPLIDNYPMKRGDCLAWMLKNGFPEPPRSACKFCPFHSDAEWTRLRDEEPQEFLDSVRFERELNAALDQATGTARLQGRVYLHDSCIPLDKVIFKSLPGHAQLSQFGNECEGLCGV